MKLFPILLMWHAYLGVATPMKRYVLDYEEYPLSEYGCLDGTPFIFFFGGATKPEYSNSWIIHIAGGGWCYDELDCYGRSFGSVGTTWPSVPETPIKIVQMSNDCNENPTFCNYNRAYFWYCDGNSFSSNLSEPMVVNGKNLYFKGLGNLYGGFDYLYKHLGMGSAEHVLLTGCSAGGLTTFRHADRVHELVRSRSPNLQRYGAMPMSGFFLDHTNAVGEDVYGREMRYTARMTNAKGAFNPRCVAEKGDDWPDCGFAEVAVQYQEAPMFPINSIFDSWQTACILGSTLPPNYPNQTDPRMNGRCQNLSPTWLPCQLNPYSPCTPSEKAAMLAYQHYFAGKFTSVFPQRDSFGYFLHNDHTHCGPVFNATQWNTLTVGGVKLVDAVLMWWNSLGDGGRGPRFQPHLCKSTYPEAC